MGMPVMRAFSALDKTEVVVVEAKYLNAKAEWCFVKAAVMIA